MRLDADEPEGEDFSTEVQTITLHSHLEREDHLICIALNPDTISEANEGLFLVLSIDENYEVLQENQVALAVILDDDCKKNIYNFLTIFDLTLPTLCSCGGRV